ncbi:hypothetical protein AYL99_02973 [Fonsecaea erecta]|uniref:Protein kinase domain-containing protein n=1 Tax=Fonsecaea erecta TaxID=1367422 RepID=A0A178ZWG8_9EURO|nr:hypothetical protein AYL99_02973 [Fonsecaea erecta]OAP63746.1 hypothetical protein AYL99_02973 [Fonsecaea erecta]
MDSVGVARIILHSNLHCDFDQVRSGFASITETERWLHRSKSRPSVHAGSAYVTQCRLKPEHAASTGFGYAFAVKRLLSIDAELGSEEAEIMKLLRFPHISALLGTFEDLQLFHIISYPAGCCDLGDFMHCISENLKGRLWEFRSDLPHKPKPEKMTQQQEEREKLYNWIFALDVACQLRMLQRYFLCLCQALRFLHETGVRHRDIKPENIIIDIHGNVLFTDFGISRKYDKEKNPNLASDNKSTAMTRKYQPPEVYKGMDRELRSDVWSLGCVFVEMLTLLYDISLDELNHKCLGNLGEYCNAIDELQAWVTKLGNQEPHKALKDEGVARCLTTVRNMLHIEIGQRPLSTTLWKSFDFPRQGRCPDCHPEEDSAWLKHASTDQLKDRDLARNKTKEIQKLNNDLGQQSQAEQQASQPLSQPASTQLHESSDDTPRRRSISGVLKNTGENRLRERGKSPHFHVHFSPGIGDHGGVGESPPHSIAGTVRGAGASRPGGPAVARNALRFVPEGDSPSFHLPTSQRELLGIRATSERCRVPDLSGPAGPVRSENSGLAGTLPTLNTGPASPDMSGFKSDQPLVLLDIYVNYLSQAWPHVTYGDISSCSTEDYIERLLVSEDTDQYEILFKASVVAAFDLSDWSAARKKLALDYGIFVLVKAVDRGVKISLRAGKGPARSRIADNV